MKYSIALIPFLICCGGSTQVTPAKVASATEGVETSTPTGQFTVKLQRPKQVGDRFHLDTTAKETKSEETFLGGKKHDEKLTILSVALSCDVTVLEVTAIGKVSKLKCEGIKSSMSINSVPSTLLEEGSSFVLNRSTSKEGSSIDFTPPIKLNKPQTEALHLILDRTYSNKSDDESFGVDHAVNIGDTWKPAADFAEGLAKEANMAFSTLESQVKLNGRSVLDGVPTLDLGVNINGSGTMNIKDGDTQNKVQLDLALRGDFPEDIQNRLLERREQKMRFGAEIIVPSKGVQMNLVMTKESNTTKTPL